MYKKILGTFSLAGLIIAGLAGLQSCDDSLELTNYSMNIRFTPGGEVFSNGGVYDINGTAVEFSVLRFYMSGIGLQNAAGQSILTNAYVLANPAQTTYEIGQVIAQDYTGAVFNVGIDSLVNHSDPAQYVSASVLSPQSPSVHWAWASGYIFIKIDGMYDTNGDDIPDEGFEVHLGTDQFLTKVVVPFEVKGDGEESVEVSIDFDPLKLFTGIDFPTDNTTHVGDNMPMAMAVAANIQSAFSANP